MAAGSGGRGIIRSVSGFVEDFFQNAIVAKFKDRTLTKASICS